MVGIVSGFINSGTTMHLSGMRFPEAGCMVRQPLLCAGAEDVARVFRLNEGESEHAQALRGLLLVLYEAFEDRLFYAREVRRCSLVTQRGVWSEPLVSVGTQPAG